MRHFLISLVLLLSAFSGVSAQKTAAYQVRGQVVDSLSGTAESYATVRLFPAGGKMPVATGLTEVDGKFSIATPKPGAYRLTINSIGKRPIERQVTLSDTRKSVGLGKLLVSSQDATLGVVTVKAQKPLVKAEVDKIAYSVADDPDAQTNTAIEMLRKVPMVTVDGEDNIQVNGNSSFKVYVNGKPNQMMSNNPSEILKNFPASAIKKIEVITNPGARYDAEGVAGVLNIVTVADTRTTGYSLTPNLRFDNHGLGFGFFGMTQIGKLTLSVDYGTGCHLWESDTKSSSEREVFAEETNHLFTSQGRQYDRRNQFHHGEIEGSYEFDEHNLLSVSGGLWGHSGRSKGETFYNMYNMAGERQYGYDLYSRSRNSRFSVDGSVDYQHTFGRKDDKKADAAKASTLQGPQGGHRGGPGGGPRGGGDEAGDGSDAEQPTLTLSYRFSMDPSRNKQTSTYDNLYNLPYSLTDQYADPDNKSYEHTAQLDFSTPLGTHHTISTGLKYIYRLNKSNNIEMTRTSGTTDAFQIDEERSLNYRHRGYISAAYGEYAYKLSNFKLVAGARYEYYHVKADYPNGKREAFTSNIGDLVPSLSMGYNLSETQMLRLGYNMRIDRPGIDMLSPYVTHKVYESQSYGNAHLKSEKAHNFELGYSNYGPSLSLNTTLTYSLSNDGLTDYTFLDSNGVLNTTYDNFLHSKVLSLNQFVMWNITTTTRFNLNGGASYSDYKVARTGDHNYGFQAYAFGGIQQTLPWRVKINLHGGGATGRYSLQGKSANFYFYRLSINKSFFKQDRMTVNVFAGNFLHRYHHFTNATTTDTYRNISRTRVDFLRFGVGVRYRLGSLNTKVKRTSRTIGDDDSRDSNGRGMRESMSEDNGMQ